MKLSPSPYLKERIKEIEITNAIESRRLTGRAIRIRNRFLKQAIGSG